MKKALVLAAGCCSTVVTPLLAVAAPISAQPTLPAIPGSPRSACSLHDMQSLATDAKITSVRWVAAPVPYCRVDGIVETSNPGPNTVGFMVALPQAWNGRYLMVVPGGSAGIIVNPSEEHLLAGYAVATTDKGSHSPKALDMSFRSNPAQSLDYAHRGAHVATVATQKIALSYYGRDTAPRYVMGCSGGGVSTLTEAETYPQDADGFVAAAAPTDAYVQTFWAAIAQFVSRDPRRWISPDEMMKVGQVIMAHFDDSDGVKDGLIWDASKINLTRDMFPFLNAGQFATLKLLQEGLPAVKGSSVSAPGYSLANPSLLGPVVLGRTPPPWTEKSRPPLYGSTVYSMRALRGPQFDALKQMNFNDPKQRNEESALWDKVGGYDLAPGKLAGLIQHNAKLIFWAGGSDEAIPPLYATQFGEKVRATFGAAAQTHFRGFMVPGMFHCRGGENHPTDASNGMLQAMQRWVESGEAPEQVILSNADKRIELNSTSNTAQYSAGMTEGAQPAGANERRSYLICAQPKRSVFKGNMTSSAEIADARNWACED